ncbi:MAG: alginate lyase family protein, partial [Candidatus Hydrogenedentes bacterium]|nr:alginate lyase family protein [Candidatus Hydrogenedentota bacterium]
MLVPVMVAMWASACGAEAATSVEVRVPDGPHPCVFLTPDELDAMRARAGSLDWAKPIREKTLQAADSLVAATLDIPHEGGQWSHWYSCKKDGGRLKAESPTRHVCTVCGEVYTGWPYDQVYVASRHRHWLGGIESLGLAYALEGKQEYADRAREILLTYASFYETLAKHDVRGNKGRSGGRLLAQTLDEATTLCETCVGYDLLYDAPCFSEADREAIADHLLRPMVSTIREHPAGISNWQSWHNAAVASAGFVLRDAALVDWAINDPENGFLMQMDKSVLDNGMWYEGAPSYHWYALSAHLYLLEGAARAGINLYAIPAVHRMFDGPMEQLFPDGTFPAINDSGRSSIQGVRSLYEVAYRRFADPNYAQFLTPRDSVWALLWGVDTVPDTGGRALHLATSNSRAQGLAVLRDKANETAIFFDYSQRHGGHIQPARLGIILYAHGDERLVDPGRLPYGNPMHGGWYRQTLAHNTVVVNQASQGGAPGEFKEFQAESDWALARATCPGAYEGVTLDRTVFLCGGLIVDVFQCAAQAAATFDLPLHWHGELDGLPAGAAVEALGDANGYQYLKDIRRLDGPVPGFDVKTGEDTAI